MMAHLKPSEAWLIALTGLLFSGTGWSDEPVPAGYRFVAAEHGIPYSVLYAVALTESGKQAGVQEATRPWPWTLNIAGRGYYFESRLEAWQELTAKLRKGQRSIDIGLMQVNWRYHQQRLGTPWQALDPYHNLRVGASILQDCFKTRLDWWASVGCYHAPANAVRADRYRRRVVSRWQQIVRAG